MAFGRVKNIRTRKGIEMGRVLPILFNTEMVRAILDGRKTVTRRVIKHDVNAVLDSPYHQKHPETSDKKLIERLCRSPYQPGDVLYVRETWAHVPCIACNMGQSFHIRCKENPVDYDDGNSIEEGCFIYRANYPEPQRICWRPSIHMPKQAARIWLKVTNVRVERLQEMTASESAKEGIQLPREYDTKERIYILGFADLWDSTIKKSDLSRYGWDANPWVWVIEFERCEKPESL